MILTLVLLPLSAELSVGKIDRMVEQIQGKRSSKVEIDFQKVSSPFVRVVRQESNQTATLEKIEEYTAQFHLAGIINDRALINNRWVREGEIIQGYTVEKIEEGHVVLNKLDRRIELFLPDPKKNNLIQISEG